MARSEILREIARLYIRQQRQTVACCEGTSLTECWIVTELGRSGPLPLGELARAIGFDKSWTSRAVDGLVDEGIVSKQGDADDGRKLRLSLTRKGETRFEAISEGLDAHARRVLQRIPFARRRAVQDALALLQDALSAEVS